MTTCLLFDECFASLVPHSCHIGVILITGFQLVNTTGEVRFSSESSSIIRLRNTEVPENRANTAHYFNFHTNNSVVTQLS